MNQWALNKKRKGICDKNAPSRDRHHMEKRYYKEFACPLVADRTAEKSKTRSSPLQKPRGR